MSAEPVLDIADSLVVTATGKHLSDLQRRILEDVWQRQTYSEIARRLRYTEGHIKDVASQLWRVLSQALDERVTKSNSRSVLERYWQDDSARLELVAPIGELQDVIPGFVGRDAAIAHLNQLIAQGQRAIVLQGEGGIGKTTLAQQYLENQQFETVLELLMAKETENITPAEQVVEEWLRQDFQVEPGQDFGVTLDRLKRQLRERQVGVLIDNLEPALDARGRFGPNHSRYGDLLRILCDPKGKTVTLLTSRDRLCETGATVTHYRLPGLSLETWQLFLEQRGVDRSPATLTMHRAYGGNAKAMNILAGAISGDFDGDSHAYWQANGADPLTALDLKNLVTSQVMRLKALDADAYQLFCRLGAYRYQDVPRVPTEGLLALMWDISPERHRQVITSLRNRSLVESYKGQYWLHPVVQAEALERLRFHEDWQLTHRQAIQFWNQHVDQIASIAGATQALEAYYHALTIADYGTAAEVFLNSRHNQWGQYLTLGSTLYRMGLLQPVRAAIPTLLPHLPDDQRASELRNILADVYWISGQIHAAIATQEKARMIACQGLQAAIKGNVDAHQLYCWRMLEVDALLSLGLYHLDLWELSKAAWYFHTVVTTARNTAHQGWADKASLCLALVASQGISIEVTSPAPDTLTPSPYKLAEALAEQAYQTIADISRPEYTGRFAFFIQLLAQTYTNLGDSGRATELYERAIAFAEKSHYVQIKAKALLGLSVLSRHQGEGSQAVELGETALALFDDLGAKGDLAETHYQLGLTHQNRGQSAIAQTHFNQAVRYFTEIQAPYQVAKVTTAQTKPNCRESSGL